MQNQQQSSQVKQLKYFQLVQSNSEFMTVIRRSLTTDNGKNLQLANEYIDKNSEIRLDYENFMQCLVQVAYLIYTGKYYGLNPLIDLKDVRIVENNYYGYETRFSIVIYYQFNDSPRENNTYAPIVKDIYKYLIELYNIYEKKVKPSPMDNQYRTTLQNFAQQVGLIEAKLSEKDESQRQKQFFFCLEETDLFLEHSMLLKIKNNSMLDFLKTKFNRFKVYKERDVSYVNDFNNEKKKMKCDLDELKKKEKLIEKNIVDFFQEISKINTKFKFKSQSDQTMKTKFILVVQEVTQQPFLTRLAKLSNYQDNVMDSESQPLKQKSGYAEYQIEYNSERNSICVRLILSSIACTSQSMDYIMFQSNVLTFESGNISLEFVEEKSEKNQAAIKRNMAFRGSSCLNSKQPILQKILILMDLTMIAARVYEPELISIRKRYLQDKDFGRLSAIYQKVNHYTKVFLRCSKKVYSQ